ncbi:DUF6495 family protein [Marinoscillum furvescens]|uniref:Histidyl-tRNA synthetase n=1 Tax=Marinoscillum furvescens DSM 4134 TaxID=1122208 RepID=A0A3D9KW57_MARFU|nr:DUF6495 family protein [Marinoscillum furvescens]RED92051.1 hypothetical protein C7460_13320 [Marinoscillum furvescens DSM 4134]
MPVSPKYRNLTSDELKNLEKEFVDYLIVNGITADDWVRLKEQELDKAEDIITLFSDVVFEGVLRKVQYLEHRSSTDIKAFQCLQDKIILMGMSAESHDVDFTARDFWEKAKEEAPDGVQVYTTEKAYGKTREMELFEMIENGCAISEGQSFKAISLALASKQG